MQAQILAPAAVLALWTLVMLFWMAATRFPAMKQAGIDLRARAGGRGQDLEGVVDPRVQWKAHNYAHLVEQPTVFYAIVAILAIMGASAIDVLLAWLYVALRIAHSVWQATVNKVPVRFAIFALSSLALTVLAVSAVVATLFHNPAVVGG